MFNCLRLAPYTHYRLPSHLPHARADGVIHFIISVWATPHRYAQKFSSRHLVMSANTNQLPPGMNSIAIISSCLQSLIIGHTFLILLIPLLVALFYYSTPYSRRQPIFILNVIALTLAFTAGVITDALNVSDAILNPQYCSKLINTIDSYDAFTAKHMVRVCTGALCPTFKH